MEESNNNELQNRLTILLRLFKNRPNHLAKYLIDNDAFDTDFIIKLLESERLSDFNMKDKRNFIFEDDEDEMFASMQDFNDMEEMEEFYSSLIEIGKVEISEEDMKQNLTMSLEETIEALNDKLEEVLEEENYEEAIIIRDYMTENNIPFR